VEIGGRVEEHMPKPQEPRAMLPTPPSDRARTFGRLCVASLSSRVALCALPGTRTGVNSPV
jgi:hypothetical protein